MSFVLALCVANMHWGIDCTFQYVNKEVSADLAKRLSVYCLNLLEYSSQSHSAEDETASLFISSSGTLPRSCYAHINGGDNSLRVIPNLLTRNLCRRLSHFDADDEGFLFVSPPERTNLQKKFSLSSTNQPLEGNYSALCDIKELKSSRKLIIQQSHVDLRICQNMH